MCAWPFDFLSCLYGSERRKNWWIHNVVFLSCLYGSELANCFGRPTGLFLSCLYGSELDDEGYVSFGFFLSCLYGSEQLRFAPQARLANNLRLINLKNHYFLLSNKFIKNQCVKFHAKIMVRMFQSPLQNICLQAAYLLIFVISFLD